MAQFQWIGKSTDGKTITLRALEESMFRLGGTSGLEDGVIKTGIVVDVETSGLSSERDHIIEIGIRQFKFNRLTGEVLSLDQSYASFQDPGIPISEEVTQLTGITDEMVRGQKIDWDRVNALFNEAQIVIAHNAGFDRPFIDLHSTSSAEKIWGCSFKQINWHTKGFPSQKLEILGIYHGFFTDSHRALNDSDALLYLLSHTDAGTQKPYLLELLQNAKRVTVHVVAAGAPFETKDHLKARNYRWDNQNKYWSKQIFKDDLNAEIEWLEQTVYQGKFRGFHEEIPIQQNFKK
jgi:DNA polymerase-3 subunit epsilon